MRLARILACLLIGAAPAVADQWAYLHPKNVISFACTINEAVVSIPGQKDDQTYWFAEARVKRKSEPDWGMTVGQFPPTLKGRHDAEKACSKFMDDLTKRIKGTK